MLWRSGFSHCRHQVGLCFAFHVFAFTVISNWCVLLLEVYKGFCCPIVEQKGRVAQVYHTHCSPVWQLAFMLGLYIWDGRKGFNGTLLSAKNSALY